MEDEDKNKDKDDSFLSQLLAGYEEDYTAQSWYVKGFEDYETAQALVDIPLKEVADGYEIQLPKKLWKLVADCRLVVYRNVPDDPSGEGMRYLGTDYVGGEDAAGHPMVTMDDHWVHIGGQVCCYEADQVRETKEGTIYTGKVKARLNNKKDVVLYVEWDPVKEDTASEEADVITEEETPPISGQITGYDTQTSELIGSYMDMKGLHKLKAGDKLQFIFDTYDGEGNLIKSQPEGKKIRVSKQNRLTVEDAPLDTGEYTFGGVLTDVYQRIMTTEMIEAQIGE